MFGNRGLYLGLATGDGGQTRLQRSSLILGSASNRSGIYRRFLVRLCSGYDKGAIKSLQAFQRVPFLCIDEAHRVDPHTFMFLSR